MKKTTLILMTLAVLTISSSAFALLDPPQNLNVSSGPIGVLFNWDDVASAAKYSVDVKGRVNYSYWYWNGYWWQLKQDCAYVSVSMGTSDWYIENMADSFLWISKTDFACLLADAVYNETGNEPVFISGLWSASAKVKALNPGKQKGPQNNPFSTPDDFGVLLNRWIW